MPTTNRFTMMRHFLLLSMLLLFMTRRNTFAARHSFVTRRDSRLVIGPIGAPFGFLEGGIYNLTVYDFQIKSPKNDQNEYEAGFLLKRFESEADFHKYEQEIQQQQGSMCMFEEFKSETDDSLLDGGDDDEFANVGSTPSAADVGVFLSMRNRNKTWLPNTPSSSHEFTANEEGLYFLLYQVCPLSNSTKVFRARSFFELDLAYRNFDQFGYASYLTAGEMPLPLVFLYFSISYAFMLGIWVTNIRNIQRDKNNTKKIFAIHHLMTVLLALKTASVFLESIRYHYIKISGHAELWSFAYYTLTFLKGTFLFTVILLIGSGWSFVKPFLSQKEKRIICFVLALQVVDNVCVVILTHETEGESWYDDWSSVFHLVDIICCCTVLIPIVWQVNSLEKSLRVNDDEEEHEGLTAQQGNHGNEEEEEDSVRALSKLRLFRSFYLLVVGYIYFTRIVVYLFSTMLGYKHTWIRYFVTELGTLLFYTITGMLFKPMEDNPYLALKREEGGDNKNGAEAEVEMGKLEMNVKD